MSIIPKGLIIVQIVPTDTTVRSLRGTVYPTTPIPSAWLSSHTLPTLRTVPAFTWFVAFLYRLALRMSFQWESHLASPPYSKLNHDVLCLHLTPSIHVTFSPFMSSSLRSQQTSPVTSHLLTFPAMLTFIAVFFFFLEASLHASMVPLLSSEVEFPGCFFDGCFYKNGILHASVLGLGK